MLPAQPLAAQLNAAYIAAPRDLHLSRAAVNRDLLALLC
jgi:hypothetical protein